MPRWLTVDSSRTLNGVSNVGVVHVQKTNLLKLILLFGKPGQDQCATEILSPANNPCLDPGGFGGDDDNEQSLWILTSTPGVPQNSIGLFGITG